jgi:hypothetical protein
MSQVVPGFELNAKPSPTRLWSCKSSFQQKHFEAFLRSDVSLYTLLSYVAFSSCASMFYKFILYEYNPSNLNLFSIVYCGIFEVLFGWILLLLLYYVRRVNPQSINHQKQIEALGWIENLFFVAKSISYLFSLLTLIMNGQCEDEVVGTLSACKYGSVHQLPEGLMALMLLHPMLMSMLIKSVKSETVFFCWVMIVSFILGTIVIWDFDFSVGSFCTITFISLLNLFELQRQKFSMFFLSQELRGTVTENERLEKENRASELKHLIGNVAHNIKTVRI